MQEGKFVIPAMLIYECDIASFIGENIFPFASAVKLKISLWLIFFPSIWESSGVALLELRNGTWLLQTYLAHNGIGMSLSVIVVWPVKCGHADSVAYLSPASASSGLIEAFEFLGFGMGQKKKKKEVS